MGLSLDDILKEFHQTDEVYIKNSQIFRSFDIEKMEGQKINQDIKKKEGSLLVRSGRRVTRSVIKKIKQAGIKEMPISAEELQNSFLAEPLVDPKTGEVLCESNEILTEEWLNKADSMGVKKLSVVFFDEFVSGPYISNTLRSELINTKDEALLDVYRRMKPGEPAVLEVADYYFQNLFFKEGSYDLGQVGRIKINHWFNFKDIPETQSCLTKQDILHVLKRLINLRNGKGKVDDIDHLGNRRVRSVGELLENQYRLGMVRMERVVKERMSLQDKDTMMPQDLINAKSVSAVVKEFFGSSQLSQFMDQTNPLSEITHKRRISTFGPGGLTRERAGFEVRDVHPTHYGRICPIETPEGPNIGLIASMATYANINDNGFIETPYRVVKKRKSD